MLTCSKTPSEPSLILLNSVFYCNRWMRRLKQPNLKCEKHWPQTALPACIPMPGVRILPFYPQWYTGSTPKVPPPPMMPNTFMNADYLNVHCISDTSSCPRGLIRGPRTLVSMVQVPIVEKLGRGWAVEYHFPVPRAFFPKPQFFWGRRGPLSDIATTFEGI